MLWKRYVRHGEIRRRIEFLLLIKSHRVESLSEISRYIDVTPSTVWRWAKEYRTTDFYSFLRIKVPVDYYTWGTKKRSRTNAQLNGRACLDCGIFFSIPRKERAICMDCAKWRHYRGMPIDVPVVNE